MRLIIRAWQTEDVATAKTDQASLIARYAGIFHDVIGDGHHVASPLGAWLLLALCAPAAGGADAAKLADVLGGGAGQVASVAAELLADPHPLVAAAAALWCQPGAVDQLWAEGLPSPVARGGIPPQRELDQWAREHTFGLIEKFPVVLTPDVYLVLATALATKVSWECPFDLAPGGALGAGSQWPKLDRVLKSPNHPSHSAFIAGSDRIGDVAVHIGRARGGLLVASVIAAAGADRGDVIAAAHAIAIATARGEPVPRRSLADLPEGDAPLWSVRDEPSKDGSRERCAAVLPAWSATDSYDLSDPRFGFAAAAAAVGHGDPWVAKQAATASYSRLGFEAAAVTATAVRMAMLPRGGVLRTVELRFCHPYAVVAVTADDDRAHVLRTAQQGPWHGIPVFSAWMARPADARDVH
jgi:hypothetical protein